MPSGRTHDRITLWSLPVATAGALAATRSGELALWFSGGFLLGGLMLGPDLDVKSRQFKRWGPLRWLWLPYQRGMRHRSFWSHGPLVGTAGRLLYLAGALALAGLLALAAIAVLYGTVPEVNRAIGDWRAFEARAFGAVGRGAIWLLRDRGREFWAAIAGLELGAASHSLSDWIGSAVKRSRRSRAGKASASSASKSPSSSGAPPASRPERSARKGSESGPSSRRPSRNAR